MYFRPEIPEAILQTGYDYGQFKVNPKRFHCLMRAYLGFHGNDYEMTSHFDSERILRKYKLQKRNLVSEIEKEYMLYVSALGELLNGAVLVTDQAYGHRIVDPQKFHSLMWVFIGLNTQDKSLKRKIFVEAKNTLSNLGVKREEFINVLEKEYYLYTSGLSNVFVRLDIVI